MTESQLTEDTADSGAMREWSEATAKRYLRSVTLVDNAAYICNSTDHSAENNSINAGALTKNFAKRGISCSVLVPSEHDKENELLEQYLIIIKAADATILDWELTPWNTDGNKSKLCKEIINELIKDERSRQPRLIIIYTGELVSEDLVDDLKEYVSSKKGKIQSESTAQIKEKLYIDVEKGDDGISPILKDSIQDLSEDDGFGFTCNRLKVVFLSKRRTPNMSPESEVSTDDLPDKLIKHFSSLVSGLLPTAAFNAVAALRDKFDSILTIFNKNLDQAFVHHLLSTSDVSSGFVFLANLFKDELYTVIVDDEEFAKCVNLEQLKAWYADDNADPVPFFREQIEKDIFQQLLESGVDSYTKPQKKIVANSFTNCNYCSLKEFSFITTLRREAFNPERNIKIVPSLTYGTLVKKENATTADFYLCILPKCDSVRLKKDIIVPFVKLNDADDTACYLCFKSHKDCQGKTVALQLKKSWDMIESFTFTPDPITKKIIAIKDTPQSPYHFNRKNTEDKFTWLADVKDETMQDLLQRVFSKITRTGFDDSEWLRRNKDKNR